MPRHVKTPPQTPQALREGVRQGVLDALVHDQQGDAASVARKLAVAGVSGVVTALLLVLLFASHHHEEGANPWHFAVCAAAWAGLLVVCMGAVLLRIRTRSVPLAHAAVLGLVGVVLAAVIGRFCPMPTYLAWWYGTAVGAGVLGAGGAALSALCFGLLTSAMLGLSALLVVAAWGGPLAHPLSGALVLTALILPAILLQSSGAALATSVAWAVGTSFGAYLGIAGGTAALSRLGRASD